MGFSSLLSMFGRKRSRSGSLTPRPFELSKRDQLPGPQPVDEVVENWHDAHEHQIQQDAALFEKMETLLSDRAEVEKYFDHIVHGKTSNPTVIERMCSIDYWTKAEMVRVDYLARGPSLPEVVKWQYFEPHASVESNEPDAAECKALKRKRSLRRSISSLRSIVSLTDLKRARRISQSKKSDAPSEHPSMDVSDDRIDPERYGKVPRRSSLESLRDLFTRAKPEIAEKYVAPALTTIPKDECSDSDQAELKDNVTDRKAEPLQTLAYDNAVARDEPIYVGPDLHVRPNNEQVDGPFWDPRTDTISTELSKDQRIIKEIKNHIISVDYIHEFFTPCIEPGSERRGQLSNQLGEVTFEEPLRQLLMFVRCESPEHVEKFSSFATPQIVETIKFLADKEFRPAHETKTLRALLSILLALIKCSKISGRKWSYRALRQCSLKDFVYLAKDEPFQKMLSALIDMKFSGGEARRGFSNFRDRRLVIEVLSAYVTTPDLYDIRSLKDAYSEAALREARAYQVLRLLRDNVVNDFPGWDLNIGKNRPYTRWYNELKKSTEGFGGVGWIWHNRGNKLKLRVSSADTTYTSYYEQFKPTDKARADETCSTTRSHTETLVTCYMAASIDLMTTCVSSIDDYFKRTAARHELRSSRMDELFLTRLIRASETNFPAIHTAINSWFVAGQCDGASLVYSDLGL